MTGNYTPAAPRIVTGCRYGVSLLELLAVLTLMGIMAAAAASRFDRSILGDTGVRSGARALSLGILQAQRAAIRTGDAHGIVFYGAKSNVSSWAVVRVMGNGARELVDGPYTIPGDYRVQVDTDEILFDFEGNGESTLLVDLIGPHRSWRISLFPLTRMIHSREVT